MKNPPFVIFDRISQYIIIVNEMNKLQENKSNVEFLCSIDLCVRNKFFFFNFIERKQKIDTCMWTIVLT